MSLSAWKRQCSRPPSRRNFARTSIFEWAPWIDNLPRFAREFRLSSAAFHGSSFAVLVRRAGKSRSHPAPNLGPRLHSSPASPGVSNHPSRSRSRADGAGKDVGAANRARASNEAPSSRCARGDSRQRGPVPSTFLGVPRWADEGLWVLPISLQRERVEGAAADGDDARRRRKAARPTDVREVFLLHGHSTRRRVKPLQPLLVLVVTRGRGWERRPRS